MLTTRSTHRLAGRTIGVLTIALLSAVLGGVVDASATSDTAHEITVLNLCSQQVWVGLNGSGAVPIGNSQELALAPRCTTANAATVCQSGVCKNGSCSCNMDSDCAFGSSASTTAACDTGRHRCVNKLKLQAPPTFDGRIWARTGCSGTDTGFICASGQCGPPTGGNIDCQTQGAFGNLATLFELSGNTATNSDNFDVSLVSGYNLPMTVKVTFPPDAPLWHPSTSYAAGAQIVERTSGGVFGYTNSGAGGTSGTTKPIFPRKWGHEVVDAAGVTWRNTGAACATSGCTSQGIPQDQCPTALQEIVTGTYVACNVPSNTCTPGTQNCSFYQCKNGDSGAETDLFGNPLGLQSPNAASYVCYSSDDCAPGSRCLIDPEFVQAGVSLPAGSGVCMPVSQDDQCDGQNDNVACPGLNYPFVDYTCQTLKNRGDGVRVCLAPTTSGVGDVWWNYANWTKQMTTCSNDGGCSAGQKCLADVVQKGLKECATGDSCSCYSPQTCTADADCNGTGGCLDATGTDATSAGCSVMNPCYCSPQAVYSGACGATNPAWVSAAAAISEPGATWPQGFRSSCPIAYGYQYDDPASNWFCPNGTAGLNGYRVVFCGRNVP